MQNEKLSFGELCEAVRDGKKLECFGRDKWLDVDTIGLDELDTIKDIKQLYITYNFRLKKQKQKKWLWATYSGYIGKDKKRWVINGEFLSEDDANENYQPNSIQKVKVSDDGHLYVEEEV